MLFKRGASSKSLSQDVDPTWYMKGPDMLAVRRKQIHNGCIISLFSMLPSLGG
jgi:hypothetical protein